MTAAPLVPSPLFGLRTWSVVGESGAERLAGPQRGGAWPAGGDWLVAACHIDPSHDAPAPGCACGVHAWHPSRRAARRVLGRRGMVAGVVEAAGAVEVHRDGFRAERARPRALFVAPRTNAELLDRLASAYAAETVPVRRPADVVSFCEARGYGLAPDVVEALLGAETLAAARRRTRTMHLRLAATVAVIAALVAIGLAATDTPHGRTLNGRTGPVYIP